MVDLPLPVAPVIRTSPIGKLAELEQHRRQVEVLEALDLVGDAPEAGGDVAALHVHVAAEAGEAAHAVAGVDRHPLLELGLLPRGEDAAAASP